MNADHVRHLGLSNKHNITLPIALTILDPTSYPSLSRARKACRKGNVLIIRNSSKTNDCHVVTGQGNMDHPPDHSAALLLPPPAHPFIGRVGDRVYTGDTIGIQVRMGDGYSFAVVGHTKPPFDVPVI